MRDGMVICPARGETDLAEVRRLMADYLDWHHARYAAHRELIERHFDHAGYAREMAELPGDYGPPTGEILLACDGGRVLGCVAMRDLGQGQAEMRRMFVTPDAQGQGIGRALALRIMDVARGLGYRSMRLDTGPLQTEAVAMYAGLGFIRSDPHYALPEALAGVMVFMACDLTRAGRGPRIKGPRR